LFVVLIYFPKLDMFRRVRLYVLLLIVFLTPLYMQAAGWSFLWSRWVSSSPLAGQQQVLFSSTGTWYLATQSSSQVEVFIFSWWDRQPLMWSAMTWSMFTWGVFDMTLINDYPTIAFASPTQNLRVLQFDGSVRQDRNITTAWAVSDVAIDIDLSNNIYVLYKEQWTLDDWEISAQIFNWTTRSQVGLPWFSNTRTVWLAFDMYQNTPFTSYGEMNNGDELAVLQYNGALWQYHQSTAVSQWLSVGDVVDVDMKVLWPNQIYVAYIDAGFWSSLVVKRKNWLIWELVWQPADFDNKTFESVSMDVAADGTIYIAAEDENNMIRIAMLIPWWNRSWINSPSYIYQWLYPFITQADGRVYVTFSDVVQLWATSVIQSVQNVDALPDSFLFASQSDLPLTWEVDSNTVTIQWINVTVPVTITGWLFSINWWAFQAWPASVDAWDTLTIRQISSSQFGTNTTATISVWSYTTNFVVQTRQAIVPSITSPAFWSVLTYSLVSVWWTWYAWDTYMLYLNGMLYGTGIIVPSTDYVYSPLLSQALSSWLYNAEVIAYDFQWNRIPGTGYSSFRIDSTYGPKITVSPQFSTWTITTVTGTVDLTWTTMILTVDGQTTSFVAGSWVRQRTLPTPLTTNGMYDVQAQWVYTTWAMTYTWFDITTWELIIDDFTWYAISITTPNNWFVSTTNTILVQGLHTWLQNITLTNSTATQNLSAFSGQVMLVAGSNTIIARWVTPYGIVYTRSIIIQYTPPATAVFGVCGSANATSTSSMPSSSLCAWGSSTAVAESTTQYSRQCIWSNGWSTASCAANKTSSWGWWGGWWGWGGGWWWGWWWGGWWSSWWWITPDNCPAWDTSWSSFDGKCTSWWWTSGWWGSTGWWESTEWGTSWGGSNGWGSNGWAWAPQCEKVWNVSNSPFNQELNDAYQYAFCIWSTTIDDITKADLTRRIKRRDFAKMISVFAQDRFATEPDLSRSCVTRKYGKTILCAFGMPARYYVTQKWRNSWYEFSPRQIRQ